MENIDVLLSDEYVAYAEKITTIHRTMKEKNEVIKRLLDAYKVEKAELEKSAKDLTVAWEETKKTLKK